MKTKTVTKKIKSTNWKVPGLKLCSVIWHPVHVLPQAIDANAKINP
jgi:hypothetical protein